MKIPLVGGRERMVVGGQYGLVSGRRSPSALMSPSALQVSDYITARLRARQDFLERLRAESTRPAAVVDLSVLLALLVGRVDIQITPDDPRADELYTHLYRRFLHGKVERAVEDYLSCGLGGIALTPYGIFSARPENTVCLGSWHEPIAVMRRFSIHPADAKVWFPDSDRWDELLSRDEDAGGVWEDNLIEVDEYLDQEGFLYFYENVLVGRQERLPWHDYYMLLADERYEVRGKQYSDLDLPVGLLERLAGSSVQEMNLYLAHQILTESIVLKGRRANVCAVNENAVKKESPWLREFIQTYKPIATTTQGQAVQIIDNVPMGEIHAALATVDQLRVALSGVTPYMTGNVGIARTATETLTMQSQSNIRTSYFQVREQMWLESVLHGYLMYLTYLPEHLHVPVVMQYHESGSELPLTTVFGPNLPYRVLLEGKRVTLVTMGLQEELVRRQETQLLLEFLGNLYPVLSQQGVQYDLVKLADRLLASYGLDPSEYHVASAPLSSSDSLGFVDPSLMAGSGGGVESEAFDYAQLQEALARQGIISDEV